MAWKSINSVITLTEQERMKHDPEYGVAVQRLRVRECTVEDVDLFNSRLVKSVTNDNGMDMGQTGQLFSGSHRSHEPVARNIKPQKGSRQLYKR